MRVRKTPTRQKVPTEPGCEERGETDWLPNLPPCSLQECGLAIPVNARPLKTVTIVSMWCKVGCGNHAIEYDVLVEPHETVFKTLENAYSLTNIDGRPLAREVCSTAAGDIMKLDGKNYLVEPRGFHELTDSEVHKIIDELHATQTMFGYDSLKQGGLL